jgi:hypothetical protein
MDWADGRGGLKMFCAARENRKCVSKTLAANLNLN